MRKLTNNDTKKQTTIPTQGNLNDIIAILNQTPRVTNAIDNVLKTIKKSKQINDPNAVKSIDNYTRVLNSVLGKSGLVMTMANAVKSLQPHTKDLIKSIDLVAGSLSKLTGSKSQKLDKTVNAFKTNLDAIYVITDYIAKKKFDTKAINAAKTNLETISGMFTVINEMFTTLREMKVPKLLFIKFIFLKLAMTQIITTCTMISSLTVLLPIIQLGVLLVKTVSVFFEHIKTVFDTISKIKITPMTFLKLVMINLAMPIMIPIMASSIGTGVLALVANEFVFQIIVFFGQINALFTSIKKTPVGPLMIPKLLLMLMVLGYSNMIIAYGLTMGTMLDYLKYAFGVSFGPFKEVAIIFMVINKMFNYIRTTKVGLLTTLKLKMIVKALKQITKILFKIALMVVPTDAIIKILMLTLVFKSLKSMFIHILIAAPLAILAVPAMLVLSIAFLALKYALKLFCWAIDDIADNDLAGNLIRLLMITATLTLISVMFVVLAMVAVKVVKSILWIIALLGLITVVILALVGIGFIFAVFAPIIDIAVIGLVMMITICTLLLVMSLMLRAIQSLDLDAEKIKENIRTVIDAAKTAINAIFSDNYKKNDGKSDSGFGAILKGIGGTVALFAKTILSIPFLAHAFVAISLITLLARRLKKIQKLDLKQDAVTNAINIVINAAKNVSNAICGDLSSTKAEQKNARSGKRLLRTVKQTVQHIYGIAKSLGSIQKIELDESLIKTSILHIFKVVTDINTMMEQLNSGEAIDPNVKPMKVLTLKERREKKRTMKQNAKILSKVDKVINTLNDIGGSLFSISELKMDDNFKAAVINNIQKMFEFINELDGYIAAFMVKDQNPNNIVNAQQLTKGEWKKANKKLSKVEATVATIHSVCDALNGIKDLKFDNTTKSTIETNVGLALGSIESIATIISGKSDNISIDEDKIEELNPLITYIQTLNSSFKDIGAANPKNVETNIGNYVKFVDKINSIDVEKAQKTALMFKQMSKFSSSIKGDFDKLAESLSEKLLPVLEDLKEVMGVLPEKIDTGFQNTSASIAAANTAPTTENVTAQVNRENPNLTKEETEKLVNERINERVKTDANGVAAKMDELISLLKGFGGSNVVVKTI